MLTLSVSFKQACKLSEATGADFMIRKTVEPDRLPDKLVVIASTLKNVVIFSVELQLINSF